VSKLRRITVVVCAVALVLAGCSSAPGSSEAAAPEPTYPNWPASLDNFRFRWTAEPGIDLLTGAAVPIRAYLEGRRVAEFTAGTDSFVPSEFETYPGFRNAVTPPDGTPWDGPSPVEVWDAYPELTRYTGQVMYGNEYFHLLELAPIDGGYRAYVCDGRYNTFIKSRDEKSFQTTEGTSSEKFDYVFIWRVEVRHGGELPKRAPQRGPNPAPADDVFGAVKITASSKARWGGFERAGSGGDRNASRVANQNHRRCLDRMPDSLHDMGLIAASTPTEPPAFEPAVPGWPAQAS
jgi:hypothetical protein